MSIQAVAWALDQDLPARPKLVLVSIANHANHTDGYCWLKAETIAAEAACTPRSVYRFVGGLVRNGYLKKAPRKGEDGKQRANDYWMLFNREDAAWDWDAGLDDEPDRGDVVDADQEATQEVDGAEPIIEDGTQDVVSPHDTVSHGEDAAPTDSGVLRPAESIPAVSYGPCDSRVLRKNIAEPSKTNPLNGGLGKSSPRTYRPPPPAPPQPLGSTTRDGSGEMVFVYENTRAYEAWAKVKGIQNSIDRWHQVTTKVVNGTTRYGWYFPSLFPPNERPPPGADSSLMTADDAEQFSKTG